MTRFNVLLFFVFISTCCFSQELKDILLPTPITTGGKPLMEALKDRHTNREFIVKEFTEQQISNLLWAAYGINRPESGKRTAPSAMNDQEIDLYVCLKSGIYIYDATKNILKAIANGDKRADMGKQDFVGNAAVVLVYVADYSKMNMMLSKEDKGFYAATDVGFISQNVYLFAASENLATVVLGWIEKDKMASILGLKKDQKIILTQCIGYSK